MKTTSLQIYCVAKEGAGVARDTVFQEIRPGAGFEIGVFVEETLGGGGYRKERVGVDKMFLPISNKDRHGLNERTRRCEQSGMPPTTPMDCTVCI